MDIARHRKLRRVRMTRTREPRLPVDWLDLCNLHCRVLAGCRDRGVILWVGFDEVCDYLGDGGPQRQGGPKALPLSP